MIGAFRKRRQRGAALVEMAVVFPILMMVLMGMVETARLGMVAQLVTTAARDGCRVAVLQGKSQSDVATRISSVLSSGGVGTHTVTYSPANFTAVKASAANNFVTVTVSVKYSDVTWLPLPWFLNGAKVVGSATMSSERQ